MPNPPTEEQPAPCPEVADLSEFEALARAGGPRLAVVADVLKERRHQLRRGHSTFADSLLELGDLSKAAMATIAAADDTGPHGELFAEALWPFDHRGRPRPQVGRRRLLVKAMALLLAELEKMPRFNALPPTRSVLLLLDNQGGADHA